MVWPVRWSFTLRSEMNGGALGEQNSSRGGNIFITRWLVINSIEFAARIASEKMLLQLQLQ